MRRKRDEGNERRMGGRGREEERVGRVGGERNGVSGGQRKYGGKDGRWIITFIL